jgi:hypothetical protein
MTTNLHGFRVKFAEVSGLLVLASHVFTSFFIFILIQKSEEHALDAVQLLSSKKAVVYGLNTALNLQGSIS